MKGELPNKDSVLLGLQMMGVDVQDPRAVQEHVLKLDANLRAEYLSLPQFVYLVDSAFHVLFMHMGDMELKKKIIASFVSQVFNAGWNAGRQEIIDQHLKVPESA